ncbi:unnamed protein product [Pelagomonas calceolata]|uniref:Rab-GAP TBC domain-containing protein n=1 Tax=Pelagomonas calceolata TaxID=35677 RepID=A0A7S4A4B3_9STRA|nr:unnamed protein product [Pelagomonas calceolata]
MEAAPPPPKRRSVGGDATNTAPETAASRKRKSTDAADPMMRAATARRRSLGGKRKSRGSPTTTDATGAASRKRTSVGDGMTSRKRRSLTSDEGVASRVKRRRSLEGAPLFSPPDKEATPKKASPGAAELSFFSPAASAKRSRAWSVRCSARRAADAWSEHDGWLPSKGEEETFMTLVESRGCPPAKRLEAWAAWASGPSTELLLELSSDAALETQISKDVKRTLRGTPYFRDGDGATYLAAFLRTRAAEDTSVGYVQGMNYVAAFCLLVARGDADADANPAPTARDDAARAYDAFRALTGLCRGYYVDGFPALHRDVRVFSDLLSEHLPEIAAHLEKVRAEAMTYAPRFLMALFLHMLPGHVVARLLDCVLAASAVDPAGGSDATSAVLVHALLAVVAAAKDELVATDDFCAAQAALVRAARNTPSFEKLRRRAPCSVEACRAALTRPVPPPQAPPSRSPQRLFPLPPPPPAAPPTGILQNLRSWFENDEYATDTMRRPRLSPRPRRSARRSAGVELSTFAQRAASPVRFALEALSPAPVRGDNPLSRWV